jgi:protein-tyrosine phosphatase
MVDRLNAAKEVYELLDQMGIQWSAGAEIRITPEIMKMDLKKFCYVDTDYVLLEWPFTQYPLYGEELVLKQIQRGLKPIFAHIERYDYFWNDPEELESYIDYGVLCHINAGALIHRNTRKQALKLIKEGYVHFICSDCHNMESRPPRLLEAYEILESELGREYAVNLMENADKVFHNEEVKTGIKKNRSFRLFHRG